MPCSADSFDRSDLSGRSASPGVVSCLIHLCAPTGPGLFLGAPWTQCCRKDELGEIHFRFVASSGPGFTITVPFMPALSWIVHT